MCIYIYIYIMMQAGYRCFRLSIQVSTPRIGARSMCIDQLDTMLSLALHTRALHCQHPTPAPAQNIYLSLPQENTYSFKADNADASVDSPTRAAILFTEHLSYRLFVCPND